MRKIVLILFVSTLYLWFGISIVRTFINLGKFVVSEMHLVLSSEEQRRRETYGELYDFCIFVNDNTTERSTIYFLTSDVHAFYFCRYEVYPRKMFLIKDLNSTSAYTIKENDYLLVLQSNNIQLINDAYGFGLIKKYKPSSLVGALYRK